MTHPRFNPRHLNPALVFICAAMVGGLACGGTRARNTVDAGSSGGGTGGTSSQGGSGSGGVGGDTSSVGGVGSGGTSGSGMDGGTTLSTIPCAADPECSSSGLFCEPAKKLCVQCVKSADCPTGRHCLGNTCVSLAACNNSHDCASDQVCDPGRGVCVQCWQNADCALGQTCAANKCVAGCQQSIDCGAGKVCDTASRCVSCAADTDCSDTTQHCVQNTCRTACTTDKTCTPLGMLCDFATSSCVDCKGDTDCPASSFCQAGTCKADLCDPTQSKCYGVDLGLCNGSGSGWGPASICPADKPCQVYGSVATCSGASPIDGGVGPAGDGGLSPGDGPLAICTTATVNPCSSLPKFAGAQTLDGKGDDLCSVPSFVFDATNAAKVINYNNVPLAQFESIKGQVAWSGSGFVAFFEVTDTSVQTVNMKDPTQAIGKTYQGDSIEIMISSNNNVTGLTGTDNNTLHVIVPAEGPAVSVKTSNNGGASSGAHTALNPSQYKQQKTASGYAIEVQLPWPAGAPSAGTQVRFDLALNSADTNCSGVDDMRDGQLLYHVGAGAGATTCQGGDTVPFCDDRTWCATAVQP